MSEQLEGFRAHLTTLSLGEDYAAVIARMLLVFPRVEPTRLAVAGLTVARKTWLAAEWLESWNAYTGEHLLLNRWYVPPPFVPTHSDAQPRVPFQPKPKPKIIPMPTGVKFHGVQKSKSGAHNVWMRINGKQRYFGVYYDPFEAARKHDEIAAQHPLPNGKSRKLNFPLEVAA